MPVLGNPLPLPGQIAPSKSGRRERIAQCGADADGGRVCVLGGEYGTWPDISLMLHLAQSDLSFS